MADTQYAIFETVAGFCALAWRGDDVVGFRLPAANEAAAEREFRRRLPGAKTGAASPVVAGTIADARRYFEGARVDFSTVRIDLGQQDPFFGKVYEAVRRLGWGETTTYGAIAKALGAGPEGARDVGTAMARNPVPLIVPCHRVLAAGGRIGGFTAPGGADSKARMLALEGIGVAPEKPAPPQRSFGF